jgi:hypothetical protein
MSDDDTDWYALIRRNNEVYEQVKKENHELRELLREILELEEMSNFGRILISNNWRDRATKLFRNVKT